MAKANGTKSEKTRQRLGDELAKPGDLVPLVDAIPELAAANAAADAAAEARKRECGTEVSSEMCTGGSRTPMPLGGGT
jgi:hypothetical protein